MFLSAVRFHVVTACLAGSPQGAVDFSPILSLFARRLQARTRIGKLLCDDSDWRDERAEDDEGLKTERTMIHFNSFIFSAAISVRTAA
jgi:hypothetical protein